MVSCTESIPGSNEEILDYYSVELTAQGWEDVTLQAYKTDPNAPVHNSEPGVQDATYPMNYNNVVTTRRVFKRGGESIHVSVNKAEEPWMRTVHLSMANDSEPRELLQSDLIESFFQGSVGHDGYPKMEYTENIEQEQYSTQFFTSQKTPVEMHDELLKKMKAEGWLRTSNDSLNIYKKSKVATFFTKDDQLSMLLVKPSNNYQTTMALVVTASY